MGHTTQTDDSGAIIVWSTAETSTTIMAACIPVHRAFCRQLRKKLLAQNRLHSSKPHPTPPSTGKNGVGGSTTLTTLNSGNSRSVVDKLSQHDRTGSDCLSLSSGGGGCHAPTDDSASGKAILQVRDIESCDTNGREVVPSRNSGGILMTQEVKVEYHRHPEILDERDMLDERAQTQHVYALKDMGMRGDPYKGIQ